MKVGEIKTFKNVEIVVYLKQFEGTPSSPAFFFGQSVVYISFILRRSPHFDDKPNLPCADVIPTESVNTGSYTEMSRRQFVSGSCEKTQKKGGKKRK
jgi:hypothetical protein